MLHAVKSGVKSAGCGFTFRTRRNFAANADAVCVVAETKNCKQDDLFEFAERWACCHNSYNVVVILTIVNALPFAQAGPELCAATPRLNLTVSYSLELCADLPFDLRQ